MNQFHIIFWGYFLKVKFSFLWKIFKKNHDINLFGLDFFKFSGPHCDYGYRSFFQIILYCILLQKMPYFSVVAKKFSEKFDFFER